MVGKGKVMSYYEDIVEVQKKHDEKNAVKPRRWARKRNKSAAASVP
jgi:hypothetical protein